MQQLEKADGDKEVAVIDPLALRRAGMVSLLRRWAEAHALSVTALSPDMIERSSPSGSQYSLGLLNLGAQSVTESSVVYWLQLLRDMQPHTPVVVLSDRDSVEEMVAAFQAGVRGFVPTSTDPEVALRTFSFIMGGGSFFPPAALLERSTLTTRAARSHAPAHRAQESDSGECTAGGRLTARQRAVLTHLQDGRSNKAIARLLNMRESTVKVHVRQIMKKLGVANRTQAALVAFAAKPEIELNFADGPLAQDGLHFPPTAGIGIQLEVPPASVQRSLV